MRFNRFAVLSVLAAGALALGGCNAGGEKDDGASAGMVGATKEECTKGAACCKSGEKASMGAVSEKKAGCCAGKSECTTTKN